MWGIYRDTIWIISFKNAMPITDILSGLIIPTTFFELCNTTILTNLFEKQFSILKSQLKKTKQTFF